MAGPAGASRKTVTVLFCDLVGSTAIGEQLDPEPLRTLLERWYAEMRLPLERHGGTVEKFIGDAVMAIFGVPVAHEDDALRTVRAAVDMQAAAVRLGTELGIGLDVRIGINTGEVVTGDRTTTLVTGDAVNTAKRLEEAAADGEILIGETTRRLVANAVDVEPVSAVHAKGKRLPVEAWRVLATIPGASAFARRLDAPLVGRRRELAQLRDELDRADRKRSCRLVTVLGAAGVGKSRLASELLAEARPRAAVLSARCLPYGDGITFLPFADLVRSAGGEDAIEAAVAGEPDGALILDRICGALGTGETPVTTEESFWAIRRVFETIAHDRPLVVHVEDVHWAEPRFLDLLEYVAGWSRDAPILLLCLARPELLDERPRWGGRLIALEALDGDEAATLLAELEAEWPLLPDARARVLETAEGNPLFLEQLVAMLVDGGADAVPQLPPTIQALLAARLDGLDPPERTVLQRAAVVGRTFWSGAVVDLAPSDVRPDVGALLLALARKELVEPEPSTIAGEDSFRFRHALIRDAAYAALPKASRGELHERFAAWLEQRTGEDELVGYHLEQAHEYRAELGGPDPEIAARAGGLLAAAGRQAFARDDMPAALNLLERALALADLEEERPELLRELAAAHWAAGDVTLAHDLLDEAIGRAADRGNVREEWYGRLERAARDHATHTGRHELVEVATEAIAVFESIHDDLGLARAWRRLALASHTACRYADAATQSERALRHARRAGEAAEEARIVDVLCSSLLFGPEPAQSAIVRCRALLGAAGSNRVLEAAVRSTLAGLEAMQENAEVARDEAARAATTYDELGLRLLRAGLAVIVATSALLAGETGRAERELRLSYETLEAAGAGAFLATPAARLASLAVAGGRLHEAEQLLAVAQRSLDPDDRSALAVCRQAAAEVAATQGRATEAAQLAQDAVDALADTDALGSRADALALAATLAGTEPDEALELYEAKGNLAAAGRLRALVIARPTR
jgi:class 3 adenylate cyclase